MAKIVRRVAAMMDRGAPPLLDDGVEVDELLADEVADTSLPL
jgi:hypothetical protein